MSDSNITFSWLIANFFLMEECDLNKIQEEQTYFTQIIAI